MADINVNRHSDYRASLICKADGNPMDLTGYGARFRASYKSVELTRDTADLLDFTPVTGNAVNGVLNLHLTPDDTASVPSGRLMTWRVELIQPDGDQRSIGSGYIIADSGRDNDDD